jgi:hypothetical protein
MSLDAKVSATHITLTVRRDKTTRFLVILGTIYSTTILVGDANIGILHSEVGLTVPSNNKRHVAVSFDWPISRAPGGAIRTRLLRRGFGRRGVCEIVSSRGIMTSAAARSLTALPDAAAG